MENPQPLKKQSRPVLRATILGATILAAATVAVSVANEIWQRPFLGLAFIPAAPTFIVEKVSGISHTTRLGGLAFGTAVNACQRNGPCQISFATETATVAAARMVAPK